MNRHQQHLRLAREVAQRGLRASVGITKTDWRHPGARPSKPITSRVWVVEILAHSHFHIKTSARSLEEAVAAALAELALQTEKVSC